MMKKKLDYIPLLSSPGWKHVRKHSGNRNPFVSMLDFIMLIAFVFGSFTIIFSLLIATNVLAPNTSLIPLIALLLTVVIWTWIYRKSQLDRQYEIRLAEFAAVNKFTYTKDRPRVHRDASDKRHGSPSHILSNPPVSLRDKQILKGAYAGHNFSLGMHSTEYSNGEGGAFREIAFLQVELNEQLPHILFTGKGHAIPYSTTESTQALHDETKFGRCYKTYVIDAKGDDVSKLLSPRLKNALINLGQAVDIEINGKYLTFFHKRKFKLDKIPRLFELFTLLESEIQVVRSYKAPKS